MCPNVLISRLLSQDREYSTVSVPAAPFPTIPLGVAAGSVKPRRSSPPNLDGQLQCKHFFPTRHLPTPFSVTMLSGILIFNQKGENLIFRAFRNDCRPRLADVFRIQVISNAQVRSPILTLGSTTFSHVKHENIYLVAITKSNANAALVFEFLYRFIALGKGYFGKFDEEAVKNNFVLVYELLDGTLISRFNIIRSDADEHEQRLLILGIHKTQRPTH